MEYVLILFGIVVLVYIILRVASFNLNRSLPKKFSKADKKLLPLLSSPPATKAKSKENFLAFVDSELKRANAPLPETPEGIKRLQEFALTAAHAMALAGGCVQIQPL